MIKQYEEKKYRIGDLYVHTDYIAGSVKTKISHVIIIGNTHFYTRYINIRAIARVVEGGLVFDVNKDLAPCGNPALHLTPLPENFLELKQLNI